MTRPTRLVLPAVLALFAALGCDPAATDPPDGSAPDAGAASPAAYREVDCAPYVGEAPEGVACAFVTVPRRRALGDGETLDVFLVRPRPLPPGVSEGARPVVVLAGGPGAAHAAFAARRRLVVTMSERLGREVIYFEQRGVAPSAPDTACPGLDVAQTAAEERAAFDACAAELEAAGGDLHAFHTLENAADVAALPAALGVDRVDLIAGSYGTRLASKVLARHPEAVGVAVLGGVLPPSDHELTAPSFAESFTAAAADFAARCQRDPACDAELPSFELSAVMGRLEAVIARDGQVEVLGSTYRSTMEVGRLAFPMMYLAQVRDLFFAALYHAAEGTNDAFYMRIGEGDAAAGRAFVQALLATAARSVFGGSSLMSEVTRCYDGGDEDACALVGERVGDYPREAFEAREGSSHPVLMLSGAFDPATPEAHADQFVAQFPAGRRVSYPCLGHDVSRVSNLANGACVVEQVRSFLDDPDAELPDCAQALCDALSPLPGRAELTALVSEYVEGPLAAE